jgi:Protein of unknown function (DUF4232)
MSAIGERDGARRLAVIADGSASKPETRWAATALLVAAIFAACSAPAPTSTAQPSLGPEPTASASATATAVPATAGPSPSPQRAEVSLDAAPGVPFAGDEVTLTIDAYLVQSSTFTHVASATVDFGDGSTGMLRGSCAALATVEHVYHRDGDYQPNVIALITCGVATTPDLSVASTSIHILPAAPPASATWPTCTTFQLHLAGDVIGAAAGTVGVLLTLQNRSAVSCTLRGYPGLQLVAPDGRLLPTTASPATTGGGVFPAVVPHRVALAPGAFASSELSYGDNPSGTASDEPYAVACPTSAWLRVTLPGTREYGTAAVALGACSGRLEVSPIVPGPNGIKF